MIHCTFFFNYGLMHFIYLILSLCCTKYDDDDIHVIYGSLNINMDINFIEQGTFKQLIIIKPPCPAS